MLTHILGYRQRETSTFATASPFSKILLHKLSSERIEWVVTDTELEDATLEDRNINFELKP
jgi:hypothetical protein